MMTFTLLLLHLWGALFGQYVAVPFTKVGGGGGTITRLDHQIGQSSSMTSGATSASMNCAGGNWVGAVVSNFGASNPSDVLTVSSSPSNTFSHTSNYTTGGISANVAVFWAASATLNGATTVSVGLTGTAPSYVTISAFCYSNFVSGAKDKEVGIGNGAATCQPGAQTPSGNGYLQISGLSSTAVSAATINSPFTLIDADGIVGGMSNGIGSGDYLQPTASSLNPTWSATGGVALACIQVSFVP